jgi:hypothetical protein
MGRLRQGSVARRVAVGLIALYALMLQSFAAAAMPAAFNSLGGSICAQDISGSETPGGGQHRDHGACCIVACAACACAYVATAFGIVIFPARQASPLVWTSGPAIAPRPPVKFFFAARGPPQDL